MEYPEAVALYERAMYKNDDTHATWEAIEVIRKSLFEKFKPLFRERCEVSIGTGWWVSMVAACEELTKLLQRHDAEGWQWQFVQVKEKFGGIRAYGHLNNPKNDPDVCWWNDDEWAASGNVSPPPDLQLLCRAVIEKLEAATATACEICGGTGDREGNSGWIKCLCPIHRAMQVARDKKRFGKE